MRAKKLPMVILVPALTMACQHPYPVRPDDPNEARIEIVCHDGGSTASVVPNTITWDKVNHLKWDLTKASNVQQIVIEPKGTNPWPFVEPSFTTSPDKSVVARALKPGLPEGVYKYSVSAECPAVGGAAAYQVGIDPDMIIPKLAF